MAGYTYNPAASIKQSFTEAKADMGDIFAQVLQRQQRDYAVAENTFANIEALKKDLNIYGQKSVTDKANALLGNASQAILQNGKIDYTKMGEIRQAVSDIKDLKTGYALGGQEFDKWVQMGLANKDNLNSFEMYYKDLMAKMSDENLIKNPRDLQVALSDTYTNNLDAIKMIGTSYLKSNPLYKVKPTDVIDPKTKAMVRVEGEMAAGWKPDGKGGLIEPDPVIITNPDGTQTTVTWKQQALAQVNATNPQAIPALRKQYGYSVKGMSDEDLLAYAVSKIPMQSSATQVKSAAAIQAEEAQANVLGVKAKYAEKEQKADLNAKAASAAASWAQAAYTNAKAQQEEVEMLYDPYKDFTKVSFTGGSTGKPVNLTKYPIGKDVSLNVNGQQGVVKSVARDEDGGVWVEAWQNGRNQITTNVDKSDKRAGFKWRKVSNFNEFNTELAQEINVGAGIPSKQKAMVRKAIGTLYNLPTRAPGIVSAAPKSIRYTGSKSAAMVQEEIDEGLAPFKNMAEAKSYYDKINIQITQQ